MATSASAGFFTVPSAGLLEYVFLVRNTSPAPFSIYSLLVDLQYNVPIGPPWALANIQPVSAPPGWTEITGSAGHFMSGQTNFQGTAQASGYILPGAVGAFVFQSSTNPPPAKIPFGCCFWNGKNEWGFCFNGQAQRLRCVPPELLPEFWRLQRVPAKAPAGSKVVRIGAGDEEPSVTVTYDSAGNVIRMVHNSPLPRPAEKPQRQRRRR
jgi:hypothetical protein